MKILVILNANNGTIFSDRFPHIFNFGQRHLETFCNRPRVLLMTLCCHNEHDDDHTDTVTIAVLLLCVPPGAADVLCPTSE